MRTLQARPGAALFGSHPHGVIPELSARGSYPRVAIPALSSSGCRPTVLALPGYGTHQPGKSTSWISGEDSRPQNKSHPGPVASAAPLTCRFALLEPLAEKSALDNRQALSRRLLPGSQALCLRSLAKVKERATATGTIVNQQIRAR